MSSNSKIVAVGLLMISCLFSGCVGTDVEIEDSSAITPVDPPADPLSKHPLSDWDMHFVATSIDLPA